MTLPALPPYQGERAMSLDRSVMTDEQRKSVALEYL